MPVASPRHSNLKASGSAVATLPLRLGETCSFAGVPAGTYTFRVRAVNAAGPSLDSPPVTLTFPNGCTGAPAPPLYLLAYVVGNVMRLVWDPPATGAAASLSALHVGGAFTGAFRRPRVPSARRPRPARIPSASRP